MSAMSWHGAADDVASAGGDFNVKAPVGPNGGKKKHLMYIQNKGNEFNKFFCASAKSSHFCGAYIFIQII